MDVQDRKAVRETFPKQIKELQEQMEKKGKVAGHNHKGIADAANAIEELKDQVDTLNAKVSVLFDALSSGEDDEPEEDVIDNDSEETTE